MLLLKRPVPRTNHLWNEREDCLVTRTNWTETSFLIIPLLFMPDQRKSRLNLGAARSSKSYFSDYFNSYLLSPSFCWYSITIFTFGIGVGNEKKAKYKSIYIYIHIYSIYIYINIYYQLLKYQSLCMYILPSVEWFNPFIIWPFIYSTCFFFLLLIFGSSWFNSWSQFCLFVCSFIHSVRWFDDRKELSGSRGALNHFSSSVKDIYFFLFFFVFLILFICWPRRRVD